MIRIEIKSANVVPKSGIAAKTGKPYSMREQFGYAYTYDKSGVLNEYPVKFTLTLNDGQEPYAPGDYVLAPESIYTNRFGQFEIFTILKPATQVQAVKKVA